MEALLGTVDAALESFEEEMKLQGLWGNVTVVQASEFGRTITSNGLGTDHAWGGNAFVAGGAVKGGQVHGRYPDDLSEAGEEYVGRGRLVPTTPWEGLWQAVAEWFGVPDNAMAAVLPNAANFPPAMLLNASVVFKHSG